MFSHIVVLWADPAQPDAAEKILAGAKRLLADIPGVVAFHAGRMQGSPRPVVEQTYSVALNLVFASKEAEALYQTHPQHVEFVQAYVKPMVKKVLIYDFE
jgi:Stress responsive A/B Barrel Domain